MNKTDEKNKVVFVTIEFPVRVVDQDEADKLVVLDNMTAAAWLKMNEEQGLDYDLQVSEARDADELKGAVVGFD